MESLSTFWLSVLLFVLILASAFFSASETSMMAINRYRLKSLSAKNNLQAKRVEKLLKNLDYLIGGILLGNNFVNILEGRRREGAAGRGRGRDRVRVRARVHVGPAH